MRVEYASKLLCVTASLLLTVFSAASFSQTAQELPKGQVIEKVICQTQTNYSYALYLPSHYSPDKRWPIVYGFDPGARGLNPVEHFKDAAEKYGYIVVGSHDSRNGSGVPLSEIIKALWDDTHARLAIDDQRIYTTGFSGGARVAGLIGYQGRVAGVIACGAGFPQGLNPGKEIPFAFVGVVGNEDFNYTELKQLDKALDATPIEHRLIIFEGPHRWPPNELCTEAIAWMEVQAMKSARRPKDDTLLATFFKTGLEKAGQLEAAGKHYDAFIAYQALAKGFKGLRDVAEVESKAQQLANTKEVKNHLKLEKQQEQKQELVTREFLALREQLKNSEGRIQAMSELKRMIAELKKKAEQEARSENELSERLVARRLLAQFVVSSSEEANREQQLKNYAQVADNLMIAAEIRSDNAPLLFRLATAYAQSGQKKKAIEALSRAVEKGFTNAAEIEQHSAFASLRNDGEFKKLLEKLKATK